MNFQNVSNRANVVDIEKSAADAHNRGRLCAKHTFAFDSRITYSSGLPQIPGSIKYIAHFDFFSHSSTKEEKVLKTTLLPPLLPQPNAYFLYLNVPDWTVKFHFLKRRQ